MAEKIPPPEKKKEEPFDPHSVVSAISPEEQRRDAEGREHAAALGIISPELVPETGGVDISEARNPYLEDEHRRETLQTDLDVLNKVPLETVVLEGKEQGEVDKHIKARRAEEEMLRKISEIRETERKAAGEGKGKKKTVSIEPKPSVRPVRHVDGTPVVAETKKPQAEKEEFLSKLNPEDVPEYIKEALVAGETRAGWKSKLSELVGKFGEGAKEKVEWWKSSEEHLIRRSKELDAELEKIGGVEKSFRWIGEKYNKLGWKSKLAIGASLGIGAGVSAAAFSVPAALAFGAGIFVQRSAGLATMFLKFEKNSQDEKWKKEKAMGKAIAYTAAMTGAMMLLSEGVKEATQSESGQQVIQWLKQHYPFGETGAAATSSAVSETAPSPQGHPSYETPNFSNQETPQPIAPDGGVPTAAPDFKAPEVTPSVAPVPVHELPPSVRVFHAPVQPEVSAPVVEAPHNPNLFYGNPAEQGDLASNPPPPPEISAPAPEPVGGSEILEGQNIEIDDETRRKALEFVAPSSPEAPVAPLEMPATIPEAPAPIIEQVPVNEPAPFETPTSPVETSPEVPAAPLEAQIVPVEAHTVPDEVPTTHFETSIPEQPQLEQVTLPEQAPLQTVDVTQGVETPPTSIDTGVHPEAPSVNVSEVQSIVNSFNVEVSNVEPHVYADAGAEHLFVYGGSPQERASMILKYLTENPDKTVFSTDDNNAFRIPWHLVDGKLVPGAPVQTSGFFGFFKSFMGAPKPDEFANIIK